MPDSYAILTEASEELTETWCERTEVMGVGIG